ncbi:hypothetical protein [Paenibacillus xylanilyticus]|uniref:hypothetical protein n=1 Tax=Paenibacillus xylanilyticus TaxID=248903 RepID=UPI0039A008E7
MKKRSWVLSIIMSFVLLGGVFAPAGSYAAAAEDSTTTYSEEGYSEVDTTEEEPVLSADEQDFLDYMDALVETTVYEKKALDAIGGSTYVTSSNRKSIFLKLNNTAVPNYTKYVSMLKQIKPENAELKKIHAKLVKGSYAQLEGYLLFKKSVSKTKVNSAVLKQGNAKIATGIKGIEQYNKEIKAYAKALGYDL